MFRRLLCLIARIFGRGRPAAGHDLASDITNDVFNPAAGRRGGR